MPGRPRLESLAITGSSEGNPLAPVDGNNAEESNDGDNGSIDETQEVPDPIGQQQQQSLREQIDQLTQNNLEGLTGQEREEVERQINLLHQQLNDLNEQIVQRVDQLNEDIRALYGDDENEPTGSEIFNALEWHMYTAAEPDRENDGTNNDGENDDDSNRDSDGEYKDPGSGEGSYGESNDGPIR